MTVSFAEYERGPFATIWHSLTYGSWEYFVNNYQCDFFGWKAWIQRGEILRERAIQRVKQIRDSSLNEQRLHESRRDAMEVRYAGRLLNRRGSTEDRMSSWKTTIDRFLKLFCGNLVIATISAGRIPVVNLSHHVGFKCRTKTSKTFTVSNTPLLWPSN
ncbi:hypothetical protein [Methylobacterium adhaesivum]|uniref:Uncharacterized protein n=1 Tax=Methylobacterium adhaesivum TaxID=333297 RepID=A0ABT8BL69_9HYPH|nr:hypothetical protein [Methylobacterium adhaesivum]MDN3592071.1 hypothetical protein [Methylobacterium adhaesivum]